MNFNENNRFVGMVNSMHNAELFRRWPHTRGYNGIIPNHAHIYHLLNMSKGIKGILSNDQCAEILGVGVGFAARMRTDLENYGLIRRATSKSRAKYNGLTRHEVARFNGDADVDEDTYSILTHFANPSALQPDVPDGKILMSKLAVKSKAASYATMNMFNMSVYQQDFKGRHDRCYNKMICAKSATRPYMMINKEQIVLVDYVSSIMSLLFSSDDICEEVKEDIRERGITDFYEYILERFNALGLRNMYLHRTPIIFTRDDLKALIMPAISGGRWYPGIKDRVPRSTTTDVFQAIRDIIISFIKPEQRELYAVMMKSGKNAFTRMNEPISRLITKLIKIESKITRSLCDMSPDIISMHDGVAAPLKYGERIFKILDEVHKEHEFFSYSVKFSVVGEQTQQFIGPYEAPIPQTCDERMKKSELLDAFYAAQACGQFRTERYKEVMHEEIRLESTMHPRDVYRHYDIPRHAGMKIATLRDEFFGNFPRGSARSSIYNEYINHFGEFLEHAGVIKKRIAKNIITLDKMHRHNELNPLCCFITLPTSNTAEVTFKQFFPPPIRTAAETELLYYTDLFKRLDSGRRLMQSNPHCVP